MKNVLIIGLMIFLFSISSAAFIEELEVLVVDSNNRSMEGVAVWTNYQLNSIKGYVTTNKQYTNSRGIVNLKLTNTEFQEKLTKTEYTLFLEYMGQEQSHTVDAESGRRGRTYYFDINRATIRVFDEYKGGIKTNVTILDVTKETASNGYAVYNLPDGEYEIIVDFQGSKQTHPFIMEGDTLVEIPLTEYELDIELVDDKGSYLNGSVKAAGKTWTVDNGKANIKFVAIPPVLIEGIYEGRVVSKEVDPKLVNEVVLPIDLNGPEISGISQKRTNNGYELSLSISDTGKYATGVDTKISPPIVRYSVTKEEQKSQERTLNLLAATGERYSISLTDISDNAVVDYEIWAKDLSGNEVSYSDSFLAVPNQQDPEQPSDDPQIIGPDSPEDLELGEVFKWILIGLGVVVLILIGYAVIKLKSEMREDR